MSLLARVLLGACLLAMAPGLLHAQAPAPSPSPSPSPRPAPSPLAPLLAEAPLVSIEQPPAGGRPLADFPVPPVEGLGERLPSWRLIARLRETWQDNPLFEEGGEDEDTFIDSGGVTLSRTFRGSRGQLTLTGNGNGTRYHSDSDLNRFGWAAGLDAVHRFTPRTTFTLSEEVVSAYTRETGLLTGSGVLLPLTPTLSSHGAVELAHQATSRWSFAVNARYDRVDFPEADLPDGEELALGARFTRRLSSTGALDLVYVHQRNQIGPQTQPSHTAHLGWTGTSGTRWAFYLAGGATYLPETDQTAREWAPFGAVEATLNGRYGSLSARYSHSVSQALGLGRVREGDMVSVAAIRSLTTWVSVFAHYGYSLSHDVFDPTFEFDAQGYEAGLRFTLTRDLTLTGAYVQRRSSTGDDPATVSNGAHLALAYSKGF